MNVWTDEDSGEQWAEVARLQAIEAEIVLERSLDSDGYRIMREDAGADCRVFVRFLSDGMSFSAAVLVTVGMIEAGR